MALDFTGNDIVVKFTEAALSGSAAALASRHDFNAEKLARLAVEIAKAAVEELSKNG